MFTQQANSIAALFGQLGNGSLTQGVLQTLANCAQPLETRAGININAGAGSRPPRGGVINSWPNEGSGVVNQYPGNTWNSRDPTAGGDTYYGDVNYWGGDNYYGDAGPRTIVNNYNNTYNEDTSNRQLYDDEPRREDAQPRISNQFTTNLGDWYEQTFTDNSYTDLRTILQTTANTYNQQISNFAGDNYFDNTVTNNSTTNNLTTTENVFNLGAVTNEGPVTNKNDTYLTEENTFITNQNGITVNLAAFINNVLVQILINGGGNGNGRPPLPQLIGKGQIKLPEFKLNPEDCTITPKGATVPVEVTITPVGR